MDNSWEEEYEDDGYSLDDLNIPSFEYFDNDDSEPKELEFTEI